MKPAVCPSSIFAQLCDTRSRSAAALSTLNQGSGQSWSGFGSVVLKVWGLQRRLQIFVVYPALAEPRRAGAVGEVVPVKAGDRHQRSADGLPNTSDHSRWKYTIPCSPDDWTKSPTGRASASQADRYVSRGGGASDKTPEPTPGTGEMGHPRVKEIGFPVRCSHPHLDG
ncbi:hypothetical protein SRHO_G00140550 [Serrasalmus rhombeus]